MDEIMVVCVGKRGVGNVYTGRNDVFLFTN